MENKFEIFRELVEQSQNEKRGLTIFTRGQQLVGIVTKINGSESIELRSQLFSRAVVLIDSIDAVAVS